MRQKKLSKILLTVLAVLWMSTLHLWANPVTANQAEQTARKFLASRHRPLDLAATVANSPAAARSATPQEPLLHVFNIGHEEGFVILSGDDATTTDILAYSDHGTFCYDSLPPNARAWIDGYAEQVADLRKCGAPKAVCRTVEYHPAIDSMLTCEWGQSSPYNDNCPKILGNSTVTGCVATAMAQVLYFHRYKSVDQLQAEIPGYRCYTLWNNSFASVDPFPEGSPIDWANMRDKYDASSINVEKKAVAELMAYCGAAVEMDYKPDGSGARVESVLAAVKKYFGYSSDATIKYRDNFISDNWDRLIYNELRNQRPVILSGKGSDGGHAFVCDGYDGQGYYHINWGWDNLHEYNLYCTLQDLRSDYKSCTFNNDVRAVIGLYPETKPSYKELLRLTIKEIEKKYYSYGKNTHVTLPFSFLMQNRTSSTRSFAVRLALYQNEKRLEVFDESKDTPPYFDKITDYKLPLYIKMKLSDYPQGTYQLKPECRVLDTDEWLLAEDADRWYVDVTVTETKVSFITHQYVEPEITLDDEPMSIATLRSEMPKAVYTLTGRKVGNNAEVINRLPSGVYVSGGRKVMIK